MLYPSPTTIRQHLANIAGTLMIGAMFALIGLNVASGCGQRNGACIGPGDFVSTPTGEAELLIPAHPHRG